MSGLIGVQQTLENNAMNGLLAAGRREQEREAMNEQIKAQERANRAQAVGTGMGLGASMAMGATTGTFAGPPGILAGAAIGGVVSLFANELF